MGTQMVLAEVSNSPMWCKICGITNVEDAVAATAAGADAIGLNFYPQSPRCVDSLDVAEILAASTCLKVALFVDPAEDEVRRVLNLGEFDLLQFHGAESAEFCRSFAKPYIKVIRVQPEMDLPAVMAPYTDAWAFLLDAYVPGQPGGTGKTFAWSMWPVSEQKLILAGGLTPDNVGGAIVQTRPFGVDVSGGVESADKRKKDPRKIADFVQAARTVEVDVS